MQRRGFALCPSGSEPNSIRLWAALGYGAIPVILSDPFQLPGPAEHWEAAALMVPETQAAMAALPGQLEALAADPERPPDFVGDVVDFLRDPLAVLRSRALWQWPPGEPLEFQASHPAELPLLLLRSLRDQPPQRSVLIQINDTGPRDARELLRLRWQVALRLCKQQLADRPAAVVSVVPVLEGFFTDAGIHASHP